MKQLLIVDDNDKYAVILEEYFKKFGYNTDRAVNAAEGLDKFESNPQDYYDLIVTDITMESQLAGVWMIRTIHKMGYSGKLIVASTGFDVPGGLFLSKLVFRKYGVEYLIPKTTLLKKRPLFYSVRGPSIPSESFN